MPAAQAVLRVPGGSDHRQDLVAIDRLARLIHQHQPVGIAIQRDAEIGAPFPHRGRQQLRRGGANALVDVEPIRLNAQLDHLGAQFEQHGGRHAIGGAMRAIDDDAQLFQCLPAREALLRRLDIAASGIAKAAGAAEIARADQRRRGIAGHQRLDIRLLGIGELEPVRAEQLDAIILVLVMAGAEHNAEIRAQAARQQRDGRRR